MALFSASYTDARRRFSKTAVGLNATVAAVPLINGLEVDVASWGERGKPTLIVSSGLHGVEGFFGSAVQIAAMQNFHPVSNLKIDLDEIRLVFVHGINPFGFAHGRRVDENNVDLNRNFILDSQQYRGAPAAYDKLDSFLNPQTPPNSFEPYRLKAASRVMRYGVPALKEAIVCGQYEYPQGIFYGGSERSAAAAFVADQCAGWVGDAERVVHIDLHTGLGKFGEYKILLNEHTKVEDHRWYTNTFGEKSVAGLQSTDKTAYAVSGGMGAWLQNKFSDRQYYFAGAEFGTYSPIKIVGALRAENRAHHYASADSDVYKKAKAELVECFCPASEQWRERVIDDAMQIIAAAIRGLDEGSRPK